MGSLASITREKILPTVLCVGLCGGLLFLLQRQITLLALDPDEAALLGVDVDRMRHLVLILATLTVASIVSVTGLISFIGLLAPHIARLLDRRGRKPCPGAQRRDRRGAAPAGGLCRPHTQLQ